jgi:hypothetical protein
MNEADDRLAGDPVWELFPYPAPGPVQGSVLTRDDWRWLVLVCTVVAAWFVYSPLAVVIACLAVAARDFRTGRQLARSIPDKAGGTICARFSYAWGAWKFGMTGFVLMFVTITIEAAAGRRREVPPSFVASMLLCMGGFALSAALTAWGLLKAYRSGMRVWIGEGVNQARTLFLGMLLVGFTFGMLVPISFWMGARFPRANHSPSDDLSPLLMFFGCLFGAPFVILVVLDRVCRRVVADRPGKFGPKVPTVGKWNS